MKLFELRINIDVFGNTKNIKIRLKYLKYSHKQKCNFKMNNKCN